MKFIRDPRDETSRYGEDPTYHKAHIYKSCDVLKFMWIYQSFATIQTTNQGRVVVYEATVHNRV